MTVLSETLPTVPNGVGTYSSIGAALAATITAATAAFAAGTNFYTDNGVVTLIIAAIVAWIAFFAGRSYQAGKLYGPVSVSPVRTEGDLPAPDEVL